MSTRQPVIPLGLKLLLLFTVLPLVELAILVWLAGATSLGFTILLVIVSGVIGASMARQQGLYVWMRAQREMSMGRFPAESLIDGLIILVGGALLVTPGVLTDIVGFSTLIPGVRAVYRGAIKYRFKSRMRNVGQGVHASPRGGFRVYTNVNPRGARGGESGEREESEDPSRGVKVVDESEGTPFEDDSPFGRLRK